jgi:GNAT superfamily N-acetyltransferase
MSRFRLAARVDLGVYYDADAARYDTPGLQALQIVTKEVFIAYYKHCPSIGFECDEKPIGGIIFDGEQAHIAVRPEYHGRWALLLRPALDWLFSLKTEIIADVEADNRVCIEFMKRNGWPAIGGKQGWITYRMTRQGRGR